MHHSLQVSLELFAPRHSEGYVTLLSDPVTAPFVSDSCILTREAAFQKFENLILAATQRSDRSYFAMIDAASGDFCGYIAAFDLKSEIAPISFAVLPRFRRRGAAKMAIELLATEIVRYPKVSILEARVHPGNVPSENTLLAAGFTLVGPMNGPHGVRLVYRRRLAWLPQLLFSRIKENLGWPRHH